MTNSNSQIIIERLARYLLGNSSCNLVSITTARGLLRLSLNLNWDFWHAICYKFLVAIETQLKLQGSDCDLVSIALARHLHGEWFYPMGMFGPGNIYPMVQIPP